MSNSVRYNFVAETALDTDLLLDTFTDYANALGATSFAAFTSDPLVRNDVAANLVVSSILPANEFQAWFPEGTDLSKYLEIAMHCIDQYEYIEHPTWPPEGVLNEDEFGNPIIVKGPLIRRLFNITASGSPSFSLDMSLSSPLFMASLISTGTFHPIETSSGELVDAYAMESGWAMLTEPLIDPDHLYGVGENG